MLWKAQKVGKCMVSDLDSSYRSSQNVAELLSVYEPFVFMRYEVSTIESQCWLIFGYRKHSRSKFNHNYKSKSPL